MNTTLDSRTARSLLVAFALAVVATACGDTSSSEDSDPLVVPPSPEVVLGTPPAATTSVPADAGQVEGGSVEIVTVTSFGADGSFGTFEVATGAAVLGCAGGSFADIETGYGLFRTFACEEGERNGEFHVFFNELEGAAGPGDLNARWDARSGTGAFVGLRGEGDWSAVFADGGAAGTLRGEIALEPSRDEGAATGAVLDEGALDGLAGRVEVPDGQGAVMLAVLGDAAATHASIGTDPSGVEPTPSDAFRIGSITKVFTAVAALQLVDDGLIDLDSEASEYVGAVPDGVTVGDLLGHTSGIANTHDLPNYVGTLVDDPARVWTPQETLDLVTQLPPTSEPGSSFRYSNANYVTLGLLIEAVTGEPYHEVVRTRIIEPLGLDATYLAGAEDGPEPFGAYTGVTGPVGPVDFDYTSIATAAWAAGAMVSSAEDLHELFTALFDGRIVSVSSVEQMTAGTRYGLGLELFEWTHGLVGHSGVIPGYVTFVRHDVATGRTAFSVSTGPDIDQRPAVAPLFDALGTTIGNE